MHSRPIKRARWALPALAAALCLMACSSEGDERGTGGFGGTGAGDSGSGGSGGNCIACGEGCSTVDCACSDAQVITASACYDVLPSNQCCHYDKTLICPAACKDHGGWSA